MSNHISRDTQITAIMCTEHYRRGEDFSASDIASVLNLTVSQSRDLLNIMAHVGQVEKKLVPQKQGTKNGGSIWYTKPPTKILRKRWRLKTNGQIGVIPLDRLGVPQ